MVWASLNIYGLGLLNIYGLGLLNIYGLGLLNIDGLGLLNIYGLGLLNIYGLGLLRGGTVPYFPKIAYIFLTSHNFFSLSSVQIIVIPACCLLCVL